MMENTLEDVAKQYTSESRCYPCHQCCIAWWHPIRYCHNCGNKVYRFPETGCMTYDEMARVLPKYKSGGM